MSLSGIPDLWKPFEKLKDYVDVLSNRFSTTAILLNPLWRYSIVSQPMQLGGRWWNHLEKKAPILELSFRMEMAESQSMLPVFSGCSSCATFTYKLWTENCSQPWVILSICYTCICPRVGYICRGVRDLCFAVHQKKKKKSDNTHIISSLRITVI